MTPATPATPALQLHAFSAAAAPGAARPVLHGLDLRIAPGEQVAVIGASGAGKSSLLLALAAAVAPRAGMLRIGGTDPWALGSRARQRLRAGLFLAPQTPPLPPRQRVATAVLAGRLPAGAGWRGLLLGWPADEAARAHAALAAFGLGDKLWQRVDRLSGGERQRVGLARALVSDAMLWLVDEPLSALDPTRAAQALATLQDSARAGGRTLVCSLHQVALACERFPRIVALQAGRVAYDGPAAGLTPALLAALYASEPAEGEAPGDGLAAGDAARADAPVAGPPRLPQTLCR